MIEAFDQPWKRRLEGTVGGHWGLFDAVKREPKFAWGGTVSNHPFWLLAGGRRRDLGRCDLRRGVSFRREGDARQCGSARRSTRLAAGILIGWAVENVPVESLGCGRLAPVAGAGGLGGRPRRSPAQRRWQRECRRPSFRATCSARRERPDRLQLRSARCWSGSTVLAVQVALGLVFDPRYRDFPFAPLTAAACRSLFLSSRARAARRPARRCRTGRGGFARPVRRLCRVQRRLRQLAGAVVLRGARRARRHIASRTGRARLRIRSATAKADSPTL